MRVEVTASGKLHNQINYGCKKKLCDTAPELSISKTLVYQTLTQNGTERFEKCKILLECQFFFCYGTLDDQKFIQAMQFLNCMKIKYIAMIHDMASLYNKNTGS
jgi:hypothetical protein